MLGDSAEGNYGKGKLAPFNPPQCFPVNPGKFREAFLGESGTDTLRPDFSSDGSQQFTVIHP